MGSWAFGARDDVRGNGFISPSPTVSMSSVGLQEMTLGFSNGSWTVGLALFLVACFLFLFWPIWSLLAFEIFEENAMFFCGFRGLCLLLCFGISLFVSCWMTWTWQSEGMGLEAGADTHVYMKVRNVCPNLLVQCVSSVKQVSHPSPAQAPASCHLRLKIDITM